MAVYLVTRTDSINYGETRAAVVIARNAAQAQVVAMQAVGNQHASVWQTSVVCEIDPASDPALVLTDFDG